MIRDLILNKSTLVIVLVCMLSAFTVGAVSAQYKQKYGWDMSAPDEPAPHNDYVPDSGYKADVTGVVFHVYKRWISSVSSAGCPSYPSCSEYMFEAVNTYPFPLGVMIGLDRLLHESSEIKHGKWIFTQSGWKIYDSLENNTFWWDDVSD
jgi:putative component of membrane protein insertase Oxa1/YidC/SpoIIIJ protein YidD